MLGETLPVLQEDVAKVVAQLEYHFKMSLLRALLQILVPSKFLINNLIILYLLYLINMIEVK